MFAENPYIAAQRFMDKERIPDMFLDEVVDWVMQARWICHLLFVVVAVCHCAIFSPYDESFVISVSPV